MTANSSTAAPSPVQALPSGNQSAEARGAADIPLPIVERLRTDAAWSSKRVAATPRQIGRDCTEAADTIEQLYEALDELVTRIGPRWFLEQNWAEPIAALAKARGEQ